MHPKKPATQPVCHFHPHKKITQMCLSRTSPLQTEQCTMPLCQQCVPDHIEKNLSMHCKQSVVEFQEAKRVVLGILRDRVEEVGGDREEQDGKGKREGDLGVRGKFGREFGKVRAAVGEVLDQIEKEAMEQIIGNTQKTIQHLDQLQQKVSQNNLKQIISILMQPQQPPQYIITIQKQPLKQYLLKWLQINQPISPLPIFPILPIKKNQVPMPTETLHSDLPSEQVRNSPVSSKIHVGKGKFGETELGREIQRQGERGRDGEMDLSVGLVEENRGKFQSKEKSKQIDRVSESVTKRKKSRIGIFVSTSPNSRNCHQKLFGSQPENKLYSSQASLKQGSTQPKNNKKDLTLQSPQTQPPAHSPHPQKILILKPSQPCNSRSQITTTPQKTIKSVINKQGLAENSSSSRLILRNRNHNQTCNPTINLNNNPHHHNQHNQHNHHNHHYNLKLSHSSSHYHGDRRNSGSMALLSKKNGCQGILNPQEMRDLIMRKKNQAVGARRQ